MKRIIWIASYPKSGSTWVRAFLRSYQDPACTWTINDLGAPNAAAYALFERFGAVEISDLTDDEVQRLRPILYRTIASTRRETLFLKVHDVFGQTLDGVPLFPPDVTLRAIYLVRHPFDVALSLAHHFGTSVSEALSMLCREDMFVRDRAGQCRQHLGSWSSHAKSWLDDSPFRPHVVRYEDLLADTARSFASLIEAVGLTVDQDRLVNAIEQCRFERLQAQERADGFIERPTEATAPFFRRGQSGDWRTCLTREQVHSLVRAHGEVMRRFRYLTASGDPMM
jgi:hypothetical protein